MTINRNRLFRLTAIGAFTLLLATLGAVSAAAQTEHWIHVRVEDGDDEGDVVTVNLPLSLLAAAAQMIPEEMIDEVHHETQVALDDVELSWTDLRNLWDQIRDSPDATYVTVQSRDQNLRVWKEGDFLRIGGTEGSHSGTEIDVSFPLAVVDALFSGPENRLDFGAALQALADYGPGNLVSVRDGNQTVRVWIDDQNEVP